VTGSGLVDVCGCHDGILVMWSDESLGRRLYALGASSEIVSLSDGFDSPCAREGSEGAMGGSLLPWDDMCVRDVVTVRLLPDRE
jgi:hypothetical protein